jgi:outer membrane protein assembly factor BamD (BamD/ComL family)
VPEKKPAEIEKKEVKPPVEAPKPRVYTKEQKETLDIFEQILEIYESAESRQAAAQQAKVLYARIITEYPDTPLAQESYWKLITLSIRDYSPPDFEKAEDYYDEFMAKYPRSVLKNAVDQTLMNSYLKHAEWERLLKFCTPQFKEFKESGEKPTPQTVFLYSEANYRLGKIAEAEEGFKVAVELYPTTGYGKQANKRLEEIKLKK